MNGLAVVPALGLVPERWQDVPSDRVRLSIAPTPGRGVSVAFSFSLP
jgi:hypothetical protein